MSKGKWKKKRVLPAEKAQKADISRNPDADSLDRLIRAQREKESTMVPVRVNRQTMIYVPRGKSGRRAVERWLSRQAGGGKVKDVWMEEKGKEVCDD